MGIIDEIFTVKSTVIEAIDFVLRRLVKVSWHEGLPFMESSTRRVWRSISA